MWHNEYGSNSAVAGITELHDRNTGKPKEGANNVLKRRKAHNQERPSPWGRQTIKNGGSENSSCHKR